MYVVISLFKARALTHTFAVFGLCTGISFTLSHLSCSLVFSLCSNISFLLMPPPFSLHPIPVSYMACPVFAARASLLSLLPSASLFTPHHFVSATVVLVVVSYLLALSCNDLSVILGTVGALATVPVSLTLPSLYFLCLSSLSPTLSSLPAEEEGKTRRWRVVARIGVGLGLVMTVLFMYGTYAT